MAPVSSYDSSSAPSLSQSGSDNPPMHIESAKRRVSVTSKQKTVRQRSLSWWQISFIVTNGVVGTGIFVNSSYALSASGPVGVVLGVLVAGIIVICAIQSFAELITVFPTANASVDYVRSFVDEDFGIVVGVASWYTQSVICALQVVNTINLVSFWNVNTGLSIALAILIPGCLYIINSFNVRIYGHFETTVGSIKLLMLISVFVGLCVTTTRTASQTTKEGTHFSDGITFDGETAKGTVESIFTSIGFAVFGFLGFETIAATSFEAYNSKKDLTPSVRFLPWVVIAMYVVLSALTAATVAWNDSRLSPYTEQILGGIVPNMRGGTDSNNLPAMLVAFVSNSKGADAMVAVMIYMTLSSASVALYTASRTLHGLASLVDSNHPTILVRVFGWFGLVEHVSRVPRRALAFSAIAFMWVPLVCALGDESMLIIASTLMAMAIVSAVLVWAAQCVAYIRYHWFRTKFDQQLHGQFEKYKFSLRGLHLTSLQPTVAWLGLVGCVLLLTAFFSAILWNRRTPIPKVLGLYLSPGLGLYCWTALKVHKMLQSWRKNGGLTWMAPWIKINDATDFKGILTELGRLVNPADYPARDFNEIPAVKEKMMQSDNLQQPGIGFPSREQSTESYVYQIPGLQRAIYSKDGWPFRTAPLINGHDYQVRFSPTNDRSPDKDKADDAESGDLISSPSRVRSEYYGTGQAANLLSSPTKQAPVFNVKKKGGKRGDYHPVEHDLNEEGEDDGEQTRRETGR